MRCWISYRDQHDLLNLIDHAVFILEPDGDGQPRYSFVNSFARKVIGKAEDQIVGLTAIELYSGRLGRIAFEKHLATLKAATEHSYEILLPLGDMERRVRTVLKPVLDRDGAVLQMIGSSTDISGTQLLNEVRAGVETIHGEMEDFINLAAHDLRAPMRHINMIADMLREDFTDMGDGKLALIDMLEDVGAKAMSLIGDVLAHAQATNATLDVSEFEFAALVDEIMGLLDPMERCEVSISPALIKGDRTATQMILRNLIDNAIKAARAQDFQRDDASDLALIISAADSDGQFEVSVQDNGIGFDDTSIVFLNGGKLRTDSGFGMLGVRRLIHARGGTLSASNLSDQTGALVSFTLPGSVSMMSA